jgi:hypothetical protein
MAESLSCRLSRLLAVPGIAAGGLLVALTGGAASGPVMAIFPPWWDARRAVEAAASGGAVLRLGGTGFAVLVATDGGQSRERLWRAGAWLLLDPGEFAGCGFQSK